MSEIKKKSHRLKSSQDYSVDAYFLEDGTFGLFLILKNEAIVFSELAASVIDAFKKQGFKISVIGGALKTKKRSEALEPIVIETPKNEKYVCMHNGLKFYLEFENALNPGIFLDQEENRNMLMEKIVQKGGSNLRLLNLFSYTGAFSVVARARGCETVSVDVSKRYLNWEKQNQVLNGFESGYLTFSNDCRDFLKRELKKDRRYDFVILDPPTFSRSAGKVFQVEKEMPELIEMCLGVMNSGGELLVSTNDSRMSTKEWSTLLRASAPTHALIEPGCWASGFLPSDHSLKTAWIKTG